MTSFSCFLMKKEEGERKGRRKRQREVISSFVICSQCFSTQTDVIRPCSSDCTMRQHMLAPLSPAAASEQQHPFSSCLIRATRCTPTFLYIASHLLRGNGAERLTPASLAVTHVTSLGFSTKTESVSSSRSVDDWLAGYGGNPRSESCKLLIGTH